MDTPNEPIDDTPHAQRDTTTTYGHGLNASEDCGILCRDRSEAIAMLFQKVFGAQPIYHAQIGLPVWNGIGKPGSVVPMCSAGLADVEGGEQ
jgi:hypothetical protein